ncbi:MAG: cryptochrome/photolyase family protein [candidate division KSB1 bacterium]|nr:cryptochrome/photolyase family protein [candidate division KSB1 bacterium]MDZ7273074.1 cryptochrome/photolyase family protein [candidate division KSB1 bacterium]MDZ7285177.1 cryptochrome/photolyase family protein [candidate division KSB1 bacterium]MDZ7298209.1 cryptochrome/photolyase family protein [candidate division KSB1 bacterium]MDZ7306883.1 cryptochrome/photolyase family protein [candidate division KSB1 bacterium]
MSRFYQQLNRWQIDPANRRWLFVPYDQLTAEIGPLSREHPRELGIVLIENTWKAGRRPYHKQKLALLLANLRHFALEQAARGVAVRHLVTAAPYREALRSLLPELGPLRVMEPAERELRVDLQSLVEEGGLQVIPHEGWLTTAAQLQESRNQRSCWRMDAFYRHVRRATGILMQNGKPVGGKFSMDAANRQPWKNGPPAPEPPIFTPDEITREVAGLVESCFAHHPGRLDLRLLPATRADAEVLWHWAKRECLPFFGPFEDAFSARSRSLFHTRLSALLNLHRLLPARVVREAAELDIPLASKEGFIRQILGWREFVHHVHTLTDGFRKPGRTAIPIAATPGDAGYQRWAGRSWPVSASDDPGLDGGAAPAYFAGTTPLPPAFWGRPTGMACFDDIVQAVWQEGYSHHITRLMVLANLATLLDVAPRELTDWFWVAYTDAYDWVVEPNVLGMGTFAIGDLITTKPYIAGAAYLDRMGDYCSRCRFDPKSTCPFTALYWAFLDRHEAKLRTLDRLKLVLASLRKRPVARRQRDARVFEYVRRTLCDGEVLMPTGVPA